MATKVSDKKPVSGGPWYSAGQNADGVNIWTTKKPAAPGGNTGGTSGSSGSSGRSGGGGSGGGTSSGGEGLSRYIQDYRMRFHADGPLPNDLVKRAKDGNWSIAYFEQQVRSKDGRYLSSMEAQRLRAPFNQTMKILFPGFAKSTNQRKLMESPFYKKIATWYLREGIGTKGEGAQDILYQRITGTKQWNKQNPYWKAYAKNPNASVQAEANPIAYKANLEGLKNAFQEVGLDMGDDYYSAFFKSRYASKSGLADLTTTLKQTALAAPSFNWFEGRQMNPTEFKQATLGGPQQKDLKSRLSKSLGVRSSFISSEERVAQSAMNEQNKLVRPTL